VSKPIDLSIVVINTAMSLACIFDNWRLLPFTLRDACPTNGSERASRNKFYCETIARVVFTFTVPDDAVYAKSVSNLIDQVTF
jgi:hypothetical protein